MLKKLLIVLATVTVLAAIFLTVPSPAPLFTRTHTEQFPRDAPITIIKTEQNDGNRCQKNQTYINVDLDFPFTGGDHCSFLQWRLIGLIKDEHEAAVREVLSHGANPETIYSNPDGGGLPIIVAASRDTELVKILLDNGADANAEYCGCVSCDSPLTRAIQANKADTVALLLERGANIDYRPLYSDNDRASAFEQAMRSRNPQIIQHVDEFAEKELNFRIRSRIEKVLRLVWIR